MWVFFLFPRLNAAFPLEVQNVTRETYFNISPPPFPKKNLCQSQYF